PAISTAIFTAIATLTVFSVTACLTLSAAAAPDPEAQRRSQTAAARKQAVEMAKPIKTSQPLRPAWIDDVPESEKTLSFVGISGKYVTETQARSSAREDARRQLVDYYGTLMVNKGREAQAINAVSSDVISPQIAAQQLNERIAQGAAQALGDRRFYWECFMDENNREYYVVYVEMQIDKARVARIIDEFGREKAADLQKKAAEEQDARRRQQLEKAAEFFGGNLSSSMDL
ncbi:MAG: hypothetical protein LBG74_02135, partial [Spirochaetaceae bacterium]|nr:hypothetical protein [Spirochaetaceae bacterium]